MSDQTSKLSVNSSDIVQYTMMHATSNHVEDSLELFVETIMDKGTLADAHRNTRG